MKRTVQHSYPWLSPQGGREGGLEVGCGAFQRLAAEEDLGGVRELLEGGRTGVEAAVQDLLSDERLKLVGVDLGWETDKVVRTRMSYEPRFGDWIRTRLGWQSFYSSHRTGTFVDRSLDAVGDTVVALVRNVNGRRDFTGQIGRAHV